MAVSEPIALQLRQATGNIYLHAQIYTGCMYFGAALCMWLLRAWKIGELEALAAQEEKALHSGSALDAQSTDLQSEASTGTSRKSRFIVRLFAWKKV